MFLGWLPLSSIHPFGVCLLHTCPFPCRWPSRPPSPLSSTPALPFDTPLSPFQLDSQPVDLLSISSTTLVPFLSNSLCLLLFFYVFMSSCIPFAKISLFFSTSFLFVIFPLPLHPTLVARRFLCGFDNHDGGSKILSILHFLRLTFPLHTSLPLASLFLAPASNPFSLPFFFPTLVRFPRLSHKNASQGWNPFLDVVLFFFLFFYSVLVLVSGFWF